MSAETPHKYVHPLCYVCGSPAGRYRRRVNDDFVVIKCTECGLEYTNPLPTELELTGFYTHYHDIRADRKIVELNAREHLKMLGMRYGWTCECSMLDFGCGQAIFVEVAGEKCFGVDLQSTDNPRIRQTLSQLPNCSWDFITLWGVLEHLAQPKQVIGDLVSILHGGGVIALTTVNAEGVIPYYYKPPEHLTYWTHDAFGVLTRESGLEIIAYEPYWMFQLGEVYTQRLLSRTPEEYHESFLDGDIPEIVFVPTNEIRVIMRKKY